MHGELAQHDRSDQIVLHLTRAELLLLAGSVNEAIEAVEDWEFSTRLGADKANARALRTELGDLMPVRPTLRCLREDLQLPVPTAAIPLDEIDHPILRKAAEQFAARDTPHERIVSIDDVVLFKAKTGRWRGAVFTEEPEDDAQSWLVAAGIREDGSPDDFYAALHARWLDVRTLAGVR